MARIQKGRPQQGARKGRVPRELDAAPAVAATDAPAVPDEHSEHFPIVGIGASAGGLDAFTQLLHALPFDTGMAFVVVQHLDPKHASMLTEILSQATRMPTTEVRPSTRAEPNHVYVIPPGVNMSISDGMLQLSEREAARGQFRPIDHFFRSLAGERKHLAIGVVLSGGATDGTLGLTEIKAEGGITFAQDGTAEHESMPRSAIAAGCVDYVLPPNEIAKEIARVARHPYVAPAKEEGGDVPREPELAKVLDLVRRSSGVDFTSYKHNTLYRRITRRMVLHKIEGLRDYARFVHSEPKELDALYQDILINVTSFFRNPESFEALKAKVFPKLAERRASQGPVRIWTLGCSTGEEAYSVAIAFFEFLEEIGHDIPVQIFATDLNGTGISRARTGVYPKNIEHDVSPERLRRYFAEVDGHYRVSKSIRDAVVFARHNALTDPPFSHLNLISCRNLLIYLEPVLQQRLISIMHYGLTPHGVLWLGSSETVGPSRDFWDVVDSRYRLYLRRLGPALRTIHLPAAPAVPAARAQRTSVAESVVISAPHKEAERVLLTRYAPPSVLVSADLEIMQFRGDTGPFLAPGPGKASLHLLKMVREDLLVALRGAVQKSKREAAPVREEGLRVRSNSGYRRVNIEVVPVKANTGEVCYLVLFEEPAMAKPHAKSAVGRERVAEDDREETTRLKQELTSTREYLQAVIEQQEAANEELQSANEEVQSSNEELQSLNEELETSKEEIESTNEELATLNDELNNRNVELSRINDDQINLIGSVQMAIVILGPDLRIRRFTPMAETVLNLTPSDIGRPIRDVKLKIGVSSVEQQLIDAIATVTVREQEVQDRQGRWYSLRIRPYKTLDNKIDGAVMLLVDIDALKRTESALRRQFDLLEQTHEPILVWKFDGPITYWNRAAEEIYGYSRDEALGRLRGHFLSAGGAPEVFRIALQRDGAWSGELYQTRRSGEEICVDSRMVLVPEFNGEMLVLETHHLMAARKQLEKELRERADSLLVADLRKNEFLAMLAHELRRPLAPLSNALHVLTNPAADDALRAGALDMMARQMHSVTHLVDDLLDVSRMTHGKIDLRKEPLELGAFLRRVADDVQALFESRLQILDVTVPQAPLYIEGDATRLEQVFANLLNNAAKFSDMKGHVHLTAERSAEGHTAVISVTDSGIGIAAEDLARIFDLFEQVDNSTTRSTGGLGIGLTLARGLVRMHEGTLEGRSLGRHRGSEFVVRLPLLQDRPDLSQPKDWPQASARAVTARRVLIVDDDLDTATSLADVLALAGHHVRVAVSGAAGLEAATEFEPEVVILDLGMPEMDGFDVARELRRLPGGSTRLLVALSGYGQEDHRRRSREAGFDHHLTKPAALDRLLALLAEGGVPRR